MERVGVAVIGFGTVGTGVVRLLLEEGDRLAEAAGCRLVLRRVCDVDLERPRPVRVPSDLLTTRAEDCLADPETAIVVETVGGTGVAVDLVKRALEAGKDVVTANKAALAERGEELFEAARRAGRSISFEASCAAGIPIIRAIRDGLVANRITAITAILNGTCNYILTRMSETGASYAEALAEAQQKGYAEADPSLDVGGEDARHKLAILAALAFHTRVRCQDIYVEGIEGVSPHDIGFGRQLGYRLKLLAIGRRNDEAMSLRVHPAFVPEASPLATVGGADNAVLLSGHAVGETFYRGPGAGQNPTASSIVADLVDAALGRARITFKHVCWLAGRCPALPVLPIEEVRSRYYLRFDVEDRPGVLAGIAGVLGRHDISVASVLQHEPTRPDSIPLVITTHEAREGNVQAALEAIAQLPTLAGPPVRIRMLPQPAEEAP